MRTQISQSAGFGSIFLAALAAAFAAAGSFARGVRAKLDRTLAAMPTDDEEPQFWVTGGLYRDDTFAAALWSISLGPFETRELADKTRRELMALYVSRALVRFEVVENDPKTQVQ